MDINMLSKAYFKFLISLCKYPILDPEAHWQRIIFLLYPWCQSCIFKPVTVFLKLYFDVNECAEEREINLKENVKNKLRKYQDTCYSIFGLL